MTKFYVTMTWDDWPNGGSYGTVVNAKDHVEAEQLCKLEMAASRAEERELCWHCGDDTDGGDGFDGLCPSCADISEDQELEATDAAVQRVFAEYADEWYLVDCFDVDEFIKRNKIA
jgi:hypothetical protein